VTTVDVLGIEGLPSDLFTARTSTVKLGPTGTKIVFLHGIASNAGLGTTHGVTSRFGLVFGGD